MLLVETHTALSALFLSRPPPPALAATPRACPAAPTTLSPPQRRGEESVAAMPRWRESHEASRVEQGRRRREIGEVREGGELGGRHGCELGAFLRCEEGVDLHVHVHVHAHARMTCCMCVCVACMIRAARQVLRAACAPVARSRQAAASTWRTRGCHPAAPASPRAAAPPPARAAARRVAASGAASARPGCGARRRRRSTVRRPALGRRSACAA